MRNLSPRFRKRFRNHTLIMSRHQWRARHKSDAAPLSRLKVERAVSCHNVKLSKRLVEQLQPWVRHSQLRRLATMPWCLKARLSSWSWRSETSWTWNWCRCSSKRLVLSRWGRISSSSASMSRSDLGSRSLLGLIEQKLLSASSRLLTVTMSFWGKRWQTWASLSD